MLKCFLGIFFNFIFLVAYGDSPYSSHELSDRENQLIEHIVQSIENAESHISKLTPNILKIEGMSSDKVRHFLNNICTLPGTRYLEIGTYAGSTWVSALYKNEKTIEDAIAVDNWSQFGGPRCKFMNNCKKFLKKSKYRFYTADCFKLNKKLIFNKKINIYFFDGDHTEEDQELALTYFDDIFEDLFILIVDDWNHPPAKIGTRNAIENLNYDVLYSIELPSGGNGDRQRWWNGLYVALIKKTKE